MFQEDIAFVIGESDDPGWHVDDLILLNVNCSKTTGGELQIQRLLLSFCDLPDGGDPDLGGQPVFF